MVGSGPTKLRDPDDELAPTAAVVIGEAEYFDGSRKYNLTAGISFRSTGKVHGGARRAVVIQRRSAHAQRARRAVSDIE